MNYHVRVSGDVWAGSPVIKAEIIEPQVDVRGSPEREALFNYVCGRAVELTRTRNLSLPCVVLIEKQD
jgi:hypothetical protein